MVGRDPLSYPHSNLKLRSHPIIGREPWFYPPPFCQANSDGLFLPFALSNELLSSRVCEGGWGVADYCVYR